MNIQNKTIGKLKQNQVAFCSVSVTVLGVCSLQNTLISLKYALRQVRLKNTNMSEGYYTVRL